MGNKTNGVAESILPKRENGRSRTRELGGFPRNPWCGPLLGVEPPCCILAEEEKADPQADPLKKKF